MELAILFSLKWMVTLENGLQTHSGVSSQNCRIIDADAWCKPALKMHLHSKISLKNFYKYRWFIAYFIDLNVNAALKSSNIFSNLQDYTHFQFPDQEIKLFEIFLNTRCLQPWPLCAYRVRLPVVHDVLWRPDMMHTVTDVDDEVEDSVV